MNTLKGWITTTFLMLSIASLATNAHAGIIVGNRTTSDPGSVSCTEKVEWGIIVGNVVGIIVGNFGGIIVGNVTDSEPTGCEVINDTDF